MFSSGNVWDKSPSQFLKILKLPSFYSGNSKIFKNPLRQCIPNAPPKHVITSTNNNNNNQFMANYQNYSITYFEQFGIAKRY